MAVTGTRSAEPRRWQRMLVVVLAAAAIVHSVVLALWLSPQNPVRDAVGDRALSAYVSPYFAQSWSDLAPDVQRVDESFRIRAEVRDDGTGRTTTSGWIDVTAAEGDSVRHDLDPARVHAAARRLATNLNGAMYALNARQHAVVRESYASAPVEGLRARLLAAGPGRPSAVRTYLAYDTMATRFASMYAAARLDGRIVRVQYLVGRRTVSLDGRRRAHALRSRPFAWFRFGFRPGYRASYEAQTAFDRSVGA